MSREVVAHASDSLQAHAVQFYEDEGFMADTVATFVGHGLVAGEPVLVIATEAHRSAFCERLRARSVDVSRACLSGQLTMIDARTTLDKLMVGGGPTRERFEEVLGGVFARIMAGRKQQRLCAYGEMVDLLWRDGQTETALHFEALWNELAREHPMRLLCTYRLDDFFRDADGDGFARICSLHTHVLPGSAVGDGAEQQRTQQRLDEARLRLLIDSIHDYAIFMLDPTGRVSSWNPGAQRINGWEASEIIGRHSSTFYPDEDVAAGKCELELRGAAETGRFEDEGWRLRKDGSRFWANVIISAVHGDDGQLVGFANVTRDLTERRRAEDERAALIAAKEANRAKDEFLAMLGHELRNPLAPIVTALELMKLRGDVGSSKEQVIIERQVQYVVRLVDDLLDVSRITQGKIELKKETFELATVVAKAVETASPLLEQRRHRLTIDVARRGLVLRGDMVRVSQILVNLLTNAAKYTDYEGRIEIGAWRDGHEIVMQVKDNGVGIRAELLPRLFELFVQGPRAADRSEGGLGIGLTLVRSLVHMHGGTVVALSEGPGKGSAFVVRLPASTTTTGDALSSSVKPPVGRSSAPRRVLIVDDNVDGAVLLAELCGAMGHDVRVAHDGPQALTAIQEHAPDVAVLDIGLPVMDGYELARRIRDQLGNRCRLVALTGYGQEHDRKRSEQAGFDAHLVKPVDPGRVLALIDESPPLK
jgi:PAS domain S-box-containing protein